MKTIGLIGGMSWESTAEYYRIINQTIKERLGGHHSGKILLYSVDFSEIETLQREGRWEEATEFMCHAVKRVERGGAECILICTNTMHIMAAEVQQAVKIPLLHIADATAMVIKKRGIERVALLGTKYTMEEEFYKGRLRAKYGFEVLIPPEEERDIINRTIYDELCLGKVEGKSRKRFVGIITSLKERGAQGVILGCTEISLLIKEKDSPLELFDTTAIHARAAVDFALQG
jgi:aspartate racemase